jgi:hypothetical protein
MAINRNPALVLSQVLREFVALWLRSGSPLAGSGILDVSRFMCTLDPPYYLNGDLPPIVGGVCTAFYLMQHQIEGEIADPANVAYFKFPCGWVSLCFDASTIFWRESEQPGEPVNDRYSSMLVLVNLSEMEGVVGDVLELIDYWGNISEVGANLRFSSGKTLSFRHIGDRDATLFTG